MRIVRTIAEMRSVHTPDIAFVPTMGAFHEGHLSLMRKAKELGSQVVVSIFVNPLQFGPKEDFSKYPRTEQSDAEMAEGVGVDVIFMPAVEEIYGEGETTTVEVPQVTQRWEGEMRPGHFVGVSTVVLKLFNIVQPKVAIFGQKDLQQCATIKKMVADLDVPVIIHIEPTTRETDGLAMSSRNRYLDTQERKIAPEIFRQLTLCSSSISAGHSVPAALSAASDTLSRAGFDVQYLAYVDTDTLLPLENLRGRSSIIFAGKLGGTRLIDNVPVA